MSPAVRVLGTGLDLLDGVAPEGPAPRERGPALVSPRGEDLPVPPRTRPDLALLPVWSDVRPLQGMAGFLDWRWGGHLSALMRAGLCTGRDGERVLMPGGRGRLADRLVLFGLGPLAEFGDLRARPHAQALVSLARDVGARDVLLALPEADPEGGADARLLEAVVEQLRGALGEGEGAAEPDAGAEPDGPTDPDAGVDPDAADPLRERAVPWWISAPADLVGRMRRMIDGPLRPAPRG